MNKNALGPKALKEILEIFGLSIEDRFITEATIYFRPDTAVRAELTEILFDENRKPIDKIVKKYKIVEED